MDTKELIYIKSPDMSEELKFKLLEIAEHSGFIEEIINILIDLEKDNNLISDELNGEIDKLSEALTIITKSDIYTTAKNVKSERENREFIEHMQEKFRTEKEKLKAIIDTKDNDLKKIKEHSEEKINTLSTELSLAKEEIKRLKEELEKKLNRYQILKIQNGVSK